MHVRQDALCQTELQISTYTWTRSLTLYCPKGYEKPINEDFVPRASTYRDARSLKALHSSGSCVGLVYGRRPVAVYLIPPGQPGGAALKPNLPYIFVSRF